MIPLPEGYQQRAIATDLKGIKILEPIDFIFSKLRRGVETDVEDCIQVAQTQSVTREDIRQRLPLVQLPADPISGEFLRRIDRFCDVLHAQNKS